MKSHLIKRSVSSAIAVLLLSSGPALATESGFYIGVNLGQSSFDVDNEIEEVFESFGSIDSKDNTWSFALGYRFMRYVGVEASYSDFGAVKLRASDRTTFGPGFFEDFTLSADTDVKGAAVALTGAIPIGNFEINGRLGALFADTELSFSERTVVTIPGRAPTVFTDSGSESASTTETLFGIGMGYTFGEHFHLRIDFTQISDVGDEEDTGEGDVTNLTAGFQYRF